MKHPLARSSEMPAGNSKQDKGVAPVLPADSGKTEQKRDCPNRGGQLINDTLANEDAEIVAVCDVYEPALQKAAEMAGGNVDQYGDFRSILERNDIDAVIIGTLDHWHATQAVDACDAGKDVYVEKPLSSTIHEGRRMVEVARRNKRIVQVGTHRRSSRTLAELAERIRGGQFQDREPRMDAINEKGKDGD